MDYGFIPMLNIRFVTARGTLNKVYSVRPSKVTGKHIESVVNGFCAPDLVEVIFTYNINSKAWLSFYTAKGGFNRSEFIKWWKKAKLGI